MSGRGPWAILATALLAQVAHAGLAQDVELDNAPAVMQRKKEAARLLLERGANPHIKNPAGADALELARKMNRPELVPLLECAMAIAPGQSFASACAGK